LSPKALNAESWTLLETAGWIIGCKNDSRQEASEKAEGEPDQVRAALNDLHQSLIQGAITATGEVDARPDER
jgi:hypothetical protein